jgi:hypothetical protein
LTDPRQDDLRATYDEVSSQLDELAATEAEKQATPPGTKRHARLARAAKHMADRLRHTTAIEAELAEELEGQPGPKPD